jgi:uncharacterized membrane protein YdjX (TVP38/TMEM64 family)
MRRIALKLKRVLPVLLGLIAIYGAVIVALKLIGLDNAHHLIQRAGVWAPILFFILCCLSMVIAPLSGSSLLIVGGTLFDRETGFLLGFTATLLGCSINFWISRQLGRKVAEQLIGRSNLELLDRYTGQLKGHRGILYLTLIMPLAQDIISYATGLTPISYSRFFVALSLSSVVVVAAYIYFGSSLLEALI